MNIKFVFPFTAAKLIFEYHPRLIYMAQLSNIVFLISTTFDSYFGPKSFEAPKLFEFKIFSEFPNFFRAPKYLEFPKFLRPQNNSKPLNCLRSPGLVHYGRHDCLQISHRGIESITLGKWTRISIFNSRFTILTECSLFFDYYFPVNHRVCLFTVNHHI